RVEIQGASVAAELAVDGALDGERLKLHALGPVLPALDRPDGALRKPRLEASILTKPGAKMPLDAGVDRSTDGGGLLALAIRGPAPRRRRSHRRKDELGIARPRAGQDLQHGSLEVAALLLGIPGAKGWLSNDVEDSGDRGELAPVDGVEASTIPLRGWRSSRT